MDKITTQEIGEKTVYKTSDGEIFDCEKDALTHEKWTVLKKKMNKIKSIKEGLSCTYLSPLSEWLTYPI